jgi:hypothetical protein
MLLWVPIGIFFEPCWVGYNYHSSVRVAPFLMAAVLAREHEAMPANHPHDIAGRADREFFAHV